VLSERVTDQCGAILFRPACGFIGRFQKILVKHNLNCFHMSISLHSILHILFNPDNTIPIAASLGRELPMSNRGKPLVTLYRSFRQPHLAQLVYIAVVVFQRNSVTGY
jgi:hypothetical protein